MQFALKAMINQQFFSQLNDDEKIELWYGQNTDILNETNILVTDWVGTAYRKLTSSSHDVFYWWLS